MAEPRQVRVMGDGVLHSPFVALRGVQCHFLQCPFLPLPSSLIAHPPLGVPKHCTCIIEPTEHTHIRCNGARRELEISE